MNLGGNFLKKLWCYVGGRVQQGYFCIINLVDSVNYRVCKLTFRALAELETSAFKLFTVANLRH